MHFCLHGNMLCPVLMGHTPQHLNVSSLSQWATASLDPTRVLSELRIKTTELHNPDNPISLSLDCRTDQADLVWQKQ